MNDKKIKKLNDLYYRTLDKEKYRKKLNDFLYFFVWKIVYFLFSLRGVDDKLILFVANAEYRMPNDFKILFDYCKSQGYKCLCLYKFKGGNKVIFKNELSKIKSDIVFQKYFARAKVTFLDEYYLPAYANKPKKNQRLVQLWHGCGAFKKFSYSVRDSEWGLKSDLFDRYKVHKNYTDICVSSPDIIPHWTEAFDAAPGVIKTYGTPRTDIFYDKDFVSGCRKELEEKYPGLKGKKIILWAPTLRGTDVRNSYAERAMDFSQMKKELGSDFVLLIKLHPRIADSLSFSEEEKKDLDGFIYDISKDVSVNTALCASDICITDYSSLIFEYSLLDRPMIFYAYDLDDYKDSRNFYYEYEDFVPGEIVKDTTALVKAIKNADEAYDALTVKKFREKFMSCCDGKCAQRIFNNIVKGEN